jgi:hypothetical protein
MAVLINTSAKLVYSTPRGSTGDLVPTVSPVPLGITMRISFPTAYVYNPPTTGQLYPRGDYTPRG